MDNKRYIIRYLPVFYDDLENIVTYISQELCNKTAANNLINDIENAILKITYMAEAPEIYQSKKKRQYPYRRIYVRNYVIYYVIIGENHPKIMEIRRLLYAKSDTENKIQ